MNDLVLIIIKIIYQMPYKLFHLPIIVFEFKCKDQWALFKF